MAVGILDSGEGSSGVQYEAGAISAGTDRLLVAGYAEHLPSSASIVGGVSLDWGNQTLTLGAEHESTYGSTDSYAGVFWGNDALIAAATGTDITVTGYGATNRGGLAMIVFDGAAQSSPIGNTNNGDINASLTLAVSLTVNANNAAWGITTGYGNGTGNPTISNNGGTDFTGQTTWDAFASTEGGSQSRIEATGASRSDSVTWTGATNCTAAMQVVEIKSAEATAEQEGFRWRNDDDNQINATWRQAQDVNDSIGKNQNIRLRMLTNYTGDPATTQLALHYKKNGDPDSERRAIPL